MSEDEKQRESTLLTDGRAMILQLMASCRFRVTTGDVQSTFLVAETQDGFNKALNMTMPRPRQGRNASGAVLRGSRKLRSG